MMNLAWHERFDAGLVGCILIAAVAVLAVLWPGLTLFYCGLTGHRLRTEFLSRWPVLLAFLSVTWSLWAYSLSFAPSWGSRPTAHLDVATPVAADFQAMQAASNEPENPRLVDGGGGVIGGLDFILLRGLSPQAANLEPVYPALPSRDGVPHVLFMAFQMTLFVVVPTPLFVVLARQLRGAAVMVFAVLWGTLVYAPLVHWAWGGGWLDDWGTLDSAGGLLHAGVGASALACALVCGTRGAATATVDSELSPEVPQRRVLACRGACLVWGGSLVLHSALTLTTNGATAAIAFANSHLAASAGLLAWLGTGWFVERKARPAESVIGAVAGLAAVASGCGVIVPQSALTIGIVAGVLGCLAFGFLRRRGTATGPLVVFA
ncbi:MAG: hypothetical protein WBC44_14645, partial [Planctomycetaceae bacterium]